MLQIVLSGILLGCGQPEATPEAASPPTPTDAPFGVVRYPDGTYKSMSSTETVNQLTKECDAKGPGYEISCRSLGRLYDSGMMLPQDQSRAFELFQRACDGGDMPGCNDLGMMYVDGTGVVADLTKANELFRRSCDGNHALGCNNLVLRDPLAAAPETIAYFLRRQTEICDAGTDMEACSTLAFLYFQGMYVTTDPAKAVQLFERACEKDHATACNSLGALYQTGNTVTADAEHARQLYVHACQIGSQEACLNAGIDPTQAKIQVRDRP